MFSLSEPCLNCSLRFRLLLLPAFKRHPLLYLIRPDPCMLRPDVLSDGLMKFAMLLKDHCSSCKRKSKWIKPIRVILAAVQADTRALVSRMVLVIMEEITVKSHSRACSVYFTNSSFHTVNDSLVLVYHPDQIPDGPGFFQNRMSPSVLVSVLLIVHFCGLFYLNLIRFKE